MDGLWHKILFYSSLIVNKVVFEESSTMFSNSTYDFFPVGMFTKNVSSLMKGFVLMKDIKGNLYIFCSYLLSAPSEPKNHEQTSLAFHISFKTQLS